MDLEEDDEMEN